MEFIKFNKAENIAILTIAKPQALNALSSDVLKEINSCLDQIEKDTAIRCLIVTGEGEKAFVAGADIKEIQSLSKETAFEFAGLGQKVFMRLEALSIPVIAAVNGFALGGGLELAMACDFIIAARTARFGLPEVTLGLMPGFGGSVRLARRVGPAMAKQLTFTGDMINADEALRIGLANKICEPAELLSEVNKIATTICQRAPLGVAGVKHTIESTYGVETVEAMRIEQTAFGKLFTSKDCKEGTTAFIEKRKPNFTGN